MLSLSAADDPKSWRPLADAGRLAASLACAVGLALLVAGRLEGVKLPGLATPGLAAAALVYLGSHLVRAVRLTVLVGDDRMNLKRLASLHLYTAGLGMLLPWKLSEVVRVSELAATLKSLPRAIAIVWIERAFDIASAVALFALAGEFAGKAHALAPLAALWFIFVAASLFLFWVMPENVQRLKLFVLKRYSSALAVRLLKALNAVQAISSAGQEAVRRHAGTVAALTLTVWIFELLAFALATGALDITSAAGGLLNVLATVPEGAVFTDSSLQAYVSQPPIGSMSGLMNYQGVIVLTGLILGGLFGLAYLSLARMDRRWEPRAKRKWSD